jgi:hypothetical protein
MNIFIQFFRREIFFKKKERGDGLFGCEQTGICNFLNSSP